MDARPLLWFTEIGETRNLGGTEYFAELSLNSHEAPTPTITRPHYRTIKTLVPDPAKRDALRQRYDNVTVQGEKSGIKILCECVAGMYRLHKCFNTCLMIRKTIDKFFKLLAKIC